MNGEQSVRIVYISKASSIDTIQTFWKRKIGAPGVRSNYLSSATDFFPFHFPEHLPWDRLCAVWQRPSVPLERRSTCCTLFRFYWSYTGHRLKVKWTKCWQLNVESDICPILEKVVYHLTGEGWIGIGQLKLFTIIGMNRAAMDCCGLPERNPYNWWTGSDRQVPCVSHKRFFINRSMV